jgi:hypothetical protein
MRMLNAHARAHDHAHDHAHNRTHPHTHAHVHLILILMFTLMRIRIRILVLILMLMCMLAEPSLNSLSFARSVFPQDSTTPRYRHTLTRVTTVFNHVYTHLSNQ